jgi:hypothetical protein
LKLYPLDLRNEGFKIRFVAAVFEPPMSAMGQKQTFRNVRAMSAIPPESGHCRRC